MKSPLTKSLLQTNTDKYNAIPYSFKKQILSTYENFDVVNGIINPDLKKKLLKIVNDIEF